MKWLSTAIVAFVLSATGYAAVKNASGHYLLLGPSLTIETDLSGRCVRVENLSGGDVYLVINPPNGLEASARAFGNLLKVESCSGR
ncbi:MAG: hypothetical protein JSR99_13635 [Proteobacteria bacterium]|nr:hypothetical protein [Pseudomonadota bacterium]